MSTQHIHKMDLVTAISCKKLQSAILSDKSSSQKLRKSTGKHKCVDGCLLFTYECLANPNLE